MVVRSRVNGLTEGMAASSGIRTPSAGALLAPLLGWIKWAIPLLLLPLLFWAWRSARSERPVRADVGAITSAATGGAAAGVPALVERTLTCGSRISASANGVESNLVGFLDDRTRPVDNTTWFTFDRLQFETASATLKPESQAQVRNVAEILKCYPTAAVKVAATPTTSAIPRPT